MLCSALLALTAFPSTNNLGQAPWSQYGANPQHTALSTYRTQPPHHVLWSAPVDENPQYSGNDLFIHYGTPLITQRGTVVLPVKTGVTDGFTFRAYTSYGSLIWNQPTDYSVPPQGWTPSCAGALMNGSNYVVMPGAGGTLLIRTKPDSGAGTTTRSAFYGNRTYALAAARYNANVKICTPLMVSPSNSVYFGFRTYGPAGRLSSGIARQSPMFGLGAWVSASSAAGDSSIVGPVINCAPALSLDGKYIYIAVNSGDFQYGYLLCLDAATLQTVGKVRLKDPNGNDALLPDAGTASPMVGPDGDVYFGVLESPFPYNHDRGWMLHFNKTLSAQKTTGAFGWDDTASVVPSACVPSYIGNSRYLLLTKYNNYAGVDGDGVNRIALLDPNATQTDLITGHTTMKEVISVAGVTPDSDFTSSHPNAVREWCINSAAIDPINKCAIVNSEDGVCYRWNFTTNTLDLAVTLTGGVGEAYTPTMIGLNGTSFAINNATLFAMGQ